MKVFSGNLKNKKISYCPIPSTRPTKKRIIQSIFNILRHKFAWLTQKNCSVLDAFAGSGSFGIEALSLGAEFVQFVEKQKDIAKILKNNLEYLKLSEKSKVFCGDILDLKKQAFTAPFSFDVIFLDPPYFQNLIFKSIEHLLKEQLIATTSLIIIECSKSELENTHQLLNSQGLIALDQRNYGKISISFFKKMNS